MTKTFNLNATSPTEPGGQWTWGEQVDENLLPDKTEGQADAMAHHVLDGITLDMTHAWPAPEARPGANRQPGKVVM